MMIGNIVSILSLAEVDLVRIFLVSVRIGALLLLTPILGASNVPAVGRLLVVISLAIALSSFSGMASSIQSTVLTPGIKHPGALLQAMATELALGVTLAAGIHLAFASFAVAGRLIDIQIGFGLAQVLDPESNAQLPILSTIFNQIGILIFFLVNGHHAIMRGIAYSLERFPAGQPWPIEVAYGPLAIQMTGVFSLAFALSAPVVFCMFMTEISLGILARNLPQINMLTLGIPVKIVVGLVVLSLWFGGVGSTMTRVYGEIYRTWNVIFASDVTSNLPQEPR
jgi:flagellar biosynthetic protein FliR